jgi:LPXTG-motif cell wall-anchored protein
MTRSTGRIVGAVLALVGVVLGVLGVVAGPAGADPQEKVVICHATSSHENPYNRISVNVSSIDGVGNNDHTSHVGPAWFDGIAVAWGDVIPGVQNWDAAGQAIFDDLEGPCGAAQTEEPDCDPQTDPDQCQGPCDEGEERVEGVCTPVCVPTVDNNQCTPCPQGQTPDGQGGCATPCVPSTENNRCTPCTPPQLPNGQGACTTPELLVPPQPVVVTAPVASADVVECAGPDGTPGIIVTLGNTGTADAVFTVTVDGAELGDLATRTVTPAEGVATLSLPQAEDVASTVVVTAEGLSVTVPLPGDCASEAVLPVQQELPVVAPQQLLPTEVAGVQQVRQELPRTGSANQTLLLVAGILLLLGGLSVYGSTLLAPATRRD